MGGNQSINQFSLSCVRGSMVLVIITHRKNVDDRLLIEVHSNNFIYLYTSKTTDNSRFWLFTASCSGVLFLSVVIYLAIYLPWYKKINDSQMWDIHCPHAIPCATICGSISIISFAIAIWPIWGLLSPLIVFVLVMGFIFASHFIPHCGKWYDWYTRSIQRSGKQYLYMTTVCKLCVLPLIRSAATIIKKYFFH